jgi:hypothetical protein
MRKPARDQPAFDPEETLEFVIVDGPEPSVQRVPRPPARQPVGMTLALELVGVPTPRAWARRR